MPCIHKSMPSMAPAQHPKLAADTFAKPWAKDCCLAWSAGYDISNLGCLLIASTTYQTLFIVSMWPIPCVVIMSYTEPPADHRMAHARRTSGEIGPFGTYLSSGVFNVLRSLFARRLNVLYFIRYALLKYPPPSSLQISWTDLLVCGWNVRPGKDPSCIALCILICNAQLWSTTRPLSLMLAALKGEASNTYTNQGTQLRAAESILLTICQCTPKP